MSFEKDFRQLLTQTLTVSTVATLGVGGAVTYSTSASTYRCRVVNVNKYMFDTRGQRAAVAYEAWIASTSILSPASKYTLPDGATPPVVSVDTFPDPDGHHHVRVRFGRG